MNNIAIIPARGGSKRIPRKNIKEFLGKPIIAYAIEAAINSKLFAKVVVSTDDAEISSIAESFGAEPIMRSIDNSDDYATLNDVFLEVSEKFPKADNFCVILPTSPLLTSNLLIQGYENLVNSDFDSTRPVVRFHYPIQRAFKLTNGKVSFMQPEFAKTRSQDLEPAFHDAGMFYFIKQGKQMSVGNKGAFEIESKYAQDIDTLQDWEEAELKYQILNQ